MKKLCRLCFAAFLLCILCFCAAAEGPIDPFFASSQPIRFSRQTRGADSAITVSGDLMTGNPVMFSVDVEASTYYFSVLSPVAPNSNIYQYVYLDHFGSPDHQLTFVFYYPGTFWLRIQLEYEDGNTDLKELVFSVEGEDLLARKVSQIVSACPVSGEYETALWLHDYLIEHAYYDTDLTRYYADGVLMDGYGVCDSYSKAFGMLLSAANIQSQRVLSSTHAWNAACLEGEWYNIDLTWDDPISASIPLSGEETHEYFCLPNDILFLISEHVPEGSYPNCSAISCNYAVRTGQMPWHRPFIAAITAKLDAYENQFTLELTRVCVTDDIGEITIDDPIVSYGLSARLLETDGIVYRNHAIDLTFNRGKMRNCLIDVTAHYRINENTGLILSAMSIGSEAFRGSGARIIFMDETCTKIGSFAFADMPYLEQVFIPCTVTDIAFTAFAGCDENLLIVTEPDSAAMALAKENGFCLEIL